MKLSSCANERRYVCSFVRSFWLLLLTFVWLLLLVQVLDIVRAAESLALGTHVADSNANAELVVSHPPKSPVEHEDKMHKTTTIVMSAHTLDTQPQVCAAILYWFLQTHPECCSISRYCYPICKITHTFHVFVYVCKSNQHRNVFFF